MLREFYQYFSIVKPQVGELACLRLNCNLIPNHHTKIDTMVLVLFHMLNKNEREVKLVRGQI